MYLDLMKSKRAKERRRVADAVLPTSGIDCQGGGCPLRVDTQPPESCNLSTRLLAFACLSNMSTLPKLEYYLINAFSTGTPGSGNQASVVVFPTSSDPRAEDDAFLLRTARDFGFAETAYLVPIDVEAGKWGLRWFTVEVVSPHL